MADPFTAQKLWRIDQVLRDKRATDFDFRLAYYIGSVTDRATGEARFKQSTAAEALDVTRRTIQISSERLKALGHIDISFTPSRTHVNGYRLCLEKANVASPLVGEKASEGTPINDGKANLDSPIPQIKGEQQNTKRRISAHEKANRHSHQSIPCLIPCLIPSRAREPSIADALGSLGAQLEARLGGDRARSWFGKAVITDVVGNTLTLELPTRFIADRVRSDFEPDLLACCKKILPTVERVTIVAAVATTGWVA
jgi:DnaA N-terminal domain